jgi:hypothetical protein
MRSKLPLDAGVVFEISPVREERGLEHGEIPWFVNFSRRFLHAASCGLRPRKMMMRRDRQHDYRVHLGHFLGRIRLQMHRFLLFNFLDLPIYFVLPLNPGVL